MRRAAPISALLVAGALWCTPAAARQPGDLVGPPAPSAAALREVAQPLGPRPVAPAQPGAPSPASPDTWLDRVLPMAMPLAIVLGVAVAGAVVFRRLVRHSGGLAAALGPAGRAPSGLLEVLGRYPIARGQSLVLIKIDRRVLLLSHTTPGRHGPGGFATLCQIDEPEDVASILVKISEFEGKGAAGAFDDLLRAAERSGDPWQSAVTPGRESHRAPDGDRAELWSDQGHTLVDATAGSAAAPVRGLRERLSALRGRTLHAEDAR